MKATWTKLENGEWGVKLLGSEWPQGTGRGLPVTVETQAGRKTEVVLGEHIRTFRIAGGRFVDIYEKATEAQKAQFTAEARAERERNAEPTWVDPEITAFEQEVEADLDPDLAREAYEEMQREGEMIAREEQGWSAAFESYTGRDFDGHWAEVLEARES
jgi:hypothetical protein